MINIAVPGVSGRMGLAVATAVLGNDDLTLSVATVRAANPMLGTKLLTSNLEIVASLQGSKADVLIDFTLPEGVMQHLAYCLQHKIAMVIGTTGFDTEQLQTIQQAATVIPILLSANMSLGVNVCYKLLASASKMLDSNWQVSIHDVHHQHKKDSPSGTAKQMAKVICEAGDRKLADVQIASERRGEAAEVVGVHSVSFTSPFEQVMIAHIAQDRGIYAIGAVTAAKWLYKRPPGLYSMQDVI